MKATDNELGSQPAVKWGLLLCALVTLKLSAAVLHVSLESTNPTLPYATWSGAATNIQDAVDAAKEGDMVLVTNGVYTTGARQTFVLMTNRLTSVGFSRIVVTTSIRVESVNGPSATAIDGGKVSEWGAIRRGVRCVYLGDGAVLSGFTLTNGAASRDSAERGGGVLAAPSAIVTNCIITSNAAARAGGGASGGTLHQCLLTNNVVELVEVSSGGLCITIDGTGGGACGSSLYRCQLVGNSSTADSGGAAYDCVLTDCDLIGNSAYWCGGAGLCTLYNSRVTANYADSEAGGVGNSILYNCTVMRNSAPEAGGGASGSTLYNCVVSENYCPWESGGGVATSALYHCTVTDNEGGGASATTLFNSIVYYNSGYNCRDANLTCCCTTPLPAGGLGNVTGPPLFMDAATGDFRLREDSPCIDAGTNLMGLVIVPVTLVETNGTWVWILAPYVCDPTDTLGNTRFIDGNRDGIVAWDIGAYEYDSFKPPRFTGPPKINAYGLWQSTVTGAPNKWVQVQRSSDLTNWVTAGSYSQQGRWQESQYMGAEGAKQVTDHSGNQKMMFYRVLVP